MIYFIVNPKAGSGKTKKAVSIISALMNKRGEEYSFVYTEKKDDAKRVSSLINFKKATAIVCIGGDGTLQEYVGICVGKDVSFGIIPLGSGNDFMCSVPDGMRKFRSFRRKIAYYTDKVVCRKTMLIDVLIVNGEKYCLNIGGTGMDIQILKDAQPLKKIFGGASYFISLMKNVIFYRAEKMTLTTDGKSRTEKFLLLAFCNGAYYGGKLRIAPPAQINDGSITVCTVREMPLIKLVALFPLVKPGKHMKIKQVSFVDCLKATLRFEGKRIVNLDGNLFEMKSPLTIEVVKGAVRLII